MNHLNLKRPEEILGMSIEELTKESQSADK